MDARKLWKVNTRKLAMIFSRGIVVGTCSLLRRYKTPDKDSLSINSNVGPPITPRTEKKNSFETGCVVGSLRLIMRILGECGPSQITSSVIQCIPRNMICSSSEERTMHTKGPSSLHSNCIKTFRTVRPLCVPIPFAEPFIVGSIHDCILSFCKWDQAVRLVKRLDNFVSLNTSFWHRSSLKDRLLPAAF